MKSGNFQFFFSQRQTIDQSQFCQATIFYMTISRILGQLKFNATDNQFIFSPVFDNSTMCRDFVAKPSVIRFKLQSKRLFNFLVSIWSSQCGDRYIYVYIGILFMYIENLISLVMGKCNLIPKYSIFYVSLILFCSSVILCWACARELQCHHSLVLYLSYMNKENDATSAYRSYCSLIYSHGENALCFMTWKCYRSIRK